MLSTLIFSLYGEALITAASAAYEKIACCDVGEDNPLDLISARYLSREHTQSEKQRCPLAALVTDVSQRNTTVRDVYTRVFRGFVKNLTDISNLDSEKALQNAVLMIGGVAIARVK